MKKETSAKAAILSVCKYYKGEKKNPFDWDKENAANNFWYYEQQFCHNYETGLISGNVKVEFRKFLDNLFRHLADRYDAMDDGRGFRKLYETTKVPA